MKKSILLLALTFSVFTSFAQDSKFSANLSYPITVGDNFINNYSGIIDLGIRYRFVEAGPINIGFSGNFTLLGRSYSEGNVDPGGGVNAMFIEPRVFGELNLESLSGFKPSLGVGYTYLVFTYKDGTQNLNLPNENYNGFNINLGTTYDITNRFFALAQYEFIKIKNDRADQIKYNTNFVLVKFGLGFRF